MKDRRDNYSEDWNSISLALLFWHNPFLTHLIGIAADMLSFICAGFMGLMEIKISSDCYFSLGYFPIFDSDFNQ